MKHISSQFLFYNKWINFLPILLVLILLVLNTVVAEAQISTLNSNNGSITISPKGLKGNTNNGTDTTNIALGTDALQSNTSGYENTAIGVYALQLNTTGHYNTANGYRALISNTTGSSNTAVGNNALRSNSTGSFNMADGCSTLKANLTGSYNTAVGYFALYSNLTGNYNTASGINALNANTSGFGNTVSGAYALPVNVTGFYNTVSGYLAGIAVNTGYNNTLLGAHADAAGDFINTTALGANAKVDASNKVRIGDASITAIEGQVAWSNPSDRRLKENIIYTSRLGLDFINQLQTVSYNYLADKAKVRYDGFIAQDIEQVMKDFNIPFSGLKKSADGMFSLAYSDFVIPLVNAVKEQQSQINELKKQNELLLVLVRKVAALEEEKKLLSH